MRFVLAIAAFSLAGCATTTYRLEGQEITPGGPARSPCESNEWLVLAPTRAEVANEKKGTSHPMNGLGVYRVGSNDPESITSLDNLPSSSMVDRKREELAPYQRRQLIAGGLGAAGVIAIAVGTVLFVNSFGSKTTTDAMGNRHEENPIDGTKAGVGGLTVGIGFGLGIAGLVVNPSNAERTEANATRHVFLDPPDAPKSAEDLVERHNATVRQECAAAAP
jgi:hypothetical protein